MPLDLVARHVFVEGRVQGVGFRWHTRAEARALGVAGVVQNLPDGRVEVWLEGPREAVAALEAWLARGPSGAHVSAVTASDGTPKRLHGFDITR